MRIVSALENLGLSEKEALTYVTLVECGEATPAEIAARSDLRRSTTYVVLDELRKKGLVNKVPYPRRHVYSAKDPREFVEETQAKLNSVEKAVPELLALARRKEKPRVLFYEDTEGMKTFMRYGLEQMRGKELVGFYGHTTNMPSSFKKLGLNYNNKRLLKDDVKIRAVVPDHKSLKQMRESDKQYNREVYVVPLADYDAEMSIDIGDTFVKILSFRDLQGVVIENKHIANVMRQIFEMVWSQKNS